MFQKTKAALLRCGAALFSPQLDIRVRLFNILGIAGILLSLYASAAMSYVGGEGFTLRAAAALGGVVFSALLIWYGARTGKYERCYVITVIVIFFGLFTALLVTGGTAGSLVLLPVLGVLFTVMLLRGWKGLLTASIELLYYGGVFAVIYTHPQWYTDGPGVWGVRDMSLGFCVLCGAIMLCVFGMMRLYDRQKERIEGHSLVLAQANRAKTEFFANASHEMRTPLTVISVNVQSVANILEDMGESAQSPRADKLLKNAQSEIMRLSRMVEGMLTLASVSEGANRKKTDLSALLRGTADMLRLHLQGRGNTLEAEIAPAFIVFCDADLLSQVAVNLIENAHRHTENGQITLGAARGDGEITVTVRDSGCGIATELLPRVFERGVSTGGSGLGLYLCKTVIESHGGRIWLESEPGEGTAAHFTLPVYEGQFGGEDA
jgi:two-component sensor histidine kinase